MEIEVQYLCINTNEKLTIIFNTFEELGLWIANNYDEIKIIDVIQSEE